MPTDTPERHEQLMQEPTYRRYATKLGWDKPGAITYRINSDGFRADEFDDQPCMVALGCSYTVGIGLPDEMTWARKTATALDLRCANLAWGGYSADSCYRLAEYWIPQLNTKYVCMLVPPRHRLELLLDDQDPATQGQFPLEVFSPQSSSSLLNPNDQYFKHWFLNEENSWINQRKNVLAIKQLCADLGIACSVLYAEDLMAWNERLGYARDRMHAGPAVHEQLTEQFVKAYAS
jgi:hypothetical protein